MWGRRTRPSLAYLEQKERTTHTCEGVKPTHLISTDHLHNSIAAFIYVGENVYAVGYTCGFFLVFSKKYFFYHKSKTESSRTISSFFEFILFFSIFFDKHLVPYFHFVGHSFSWREYLVLYIQEYLSIVYGISLCYICIL